MHAEIVNYCQTHLLKCILATISSWLLVSLTDEGHEAFFSLYGVQIQAEVKQDVNSFSVRGIRMQIKFQSQKHLCVSHKTSNEPL